MEVGTLTTKDEVLPGGDGLNHDCRVVPTWSREHVVDIGVTPFAGLQIEHFDFVVHGFVIPSTVSVELVVHDENGVSTTSWRRELKTSDDFDLFPLLSLKIVGVDIVEADAGVVESTMASINVDLVLVDAATGVGTWGRSSNGGLLVVLDLTISLCAGPGVLLGVEEPGVVKTHGGGAVTTENEHLVVDWRNDFGYMLRSCWGHLLATWALLFPDPLVAHHAESEDVTVGLDLSSGCGCFDTTVHNILVPADEVHGMT
jgi:hypothetical protein